MHAVQLLTVNDTIICKQKVGYIEPIRNRRKGYDRRYVASYVSVVSDDTTPTTEAPLPQSTYQSFCIVKHSVNCCFVNGFSC